VNTPIQGFAARLVVNALVRLHEKFDPEKQRILFTVHDSIMCMCKKNKTTIAQTKKMIKDTMENDLPEVLMTLPTSPHSPFHRWDQLDYNLPFVADVAIGPTWGDCHDDAESLVVIDPDEAQDAIAA
jgi:DNA polymerase I-like protein with 3'-5' exonuclease and polymerase domains